MRNAVFFTMIALLVVMQVSHRLYHLEFDQTVNRELAQRYVASNFLLTDAPLNAETLHRGIGKLAAARSVCVPRAAAGVGSFPAAGLPGTGTITSHWHLGQRMFFPARSSGTIMAWPFGQKTRKGISGEVRTETTHFSLIRAAARGNGCYFVPRKYPIIFQPSSNDSDDCPAATSS